MYQRDARYRWWLGIGFSQRRCGGKGRVGEDGENGVHLHRDGYSRRAWFGIVGSFFFLSASLLGGMPLQHAGAVGEGAFVPPPPRFEILVGIMLNIHVIST